MNALDVISSAIRSAGYRREAVVENYAFADVLDAKLATRRVALAAFTQTPPSYRSAAIGVVRSEGQSALDLVQSYRALGAPLLFVLDGDDVVVWQVRSSAPPRAIEHLKSFDLPALFARNLDLWRPEAIHRAKSIGSAERSLQLDFVDAGLLPAIEGEIHAKLDGLLSDTLRAAVAKQPSQANDTRLLFRVVFRLLAAKVLRDRGHPLAVGWNFDDLPSVLKGIEGYYSLPTSIPSSAGSLPSTRAAWETLKGGISFSNISADDLAFVYENTFVTAEARSLLGTHSTPRQVAEYIVRRLELHRLDLNNLRIYEPFAGAGIFLVSALRHLRDLLPIDWSDHRRHDFLVSRLAGDEIDSFACEVATLSLILADYPNQNGWHVAEADLFEGDVLAKRLSKSNVVICNPPFGLFSEADRERYPAARRFPSKAVAALDAALDAHPDALGFVLPRVLVRHSRFAEQRRRIEALYAVVELVDLPDRVFEVSQVEAALLIAREPRPPAPNSIKLVSTEVTDRDRVAFLRSGHTTTQRSLTRQVSTEPSGDLWISPLQELWRYLAQAPKLGEKLNVRRGLEWNYTQTDAASDSRLPGYRRGLDISRQMKQFVPQKPAWLDYRPDEVRRGYGQPWDEPKIMVNSARLSRGPWRIGAYVDNKGLLFSQQFYGLWLRGKATLDELYAFAALLNGPVANAFVTVHSPLKVIRNSAFAQIPLPRALPDELSRLAEEYAALVSTTELVQDRDARLATLITRIDAAVLGAYDLPPVLEKELLAFFDGASRPLAHPWAHWDDSHPAPGLRLFERLSGRYNPGGAWVTEVFRPLPTDEAQVLRVFGS